MRAFDKANWAEWAMGTGRARRKFHEWLLATGRDPKTYSAYGLVMEFGTFAIVFSGDDIQTFVPDGPDALGPCITFEELRDTLLRCEAERAKKLEALGQPDREGVI